MKKISGLIWSKIKERWILVDEKVASKGGPSGIVGAITLAAFLSMSGAAFSLDPGALPTGGKIASGSGSIATLGRQMTVNQSTQKMIANWDTFNIGAKAGVTFRQPDSDAIALNKIYDQNPSLILGSLSANGKIYLINPSGIVFGEGAQVNVGGLVASSLNMLDADFLSGKYIFTNTGNAGSILNQGNISVIPGGVVALIAPSVVNEGTITANSGSVILGAGNQVTLDFTGDGLISYTLDKGAVDALAANKGLIKADGGLVVMTAKAADNLTNAVVNNTGIIEAQTLENNAGRIMLMSDMASGTTIVGGKLDASAPNGGDGGFIEASGKTVKVADDAKVTTAALKGLYGSWLIDPTDYTIGTDISAATLASNLSSGNVIIQTAETGSGNGDIFVNEAVTWTSSNKLTLNAYRNINVYAPLENHAGGSLVLRSDLTGTGTGTVNNYGAYIYLTGGGRVDLYYNPTSYATPTDYASLWREVCGSTPHTAWMLVNDAAHLQNMNTNLNGAYALGRDIDASETAAWNAGLGFDPIGHHSTSFTGQFDGLNHTITNLIINRPSQDYVGLFGFNRGVVQNVGLVGGSVNGRDLVGGLVGENSGTLTNAYATGSVSGGGVVGGLIGENYYGTVSNAYATGNVIGSTCVGGLIGFNGSNSITNSYATGNVSGTNRVGGLIGINQHSTVINAYATGSVSGTDYVGGLVGYNYDSTVSNTYATGSVSGGGVVGGLVGYNYYGSIRNSYATGSVSGSYNIGGLMGINGSTVNNSYWDTVTSGQATSAGGIGLTTAQMMQTANFSGWDFGSTWFLIPGSTRPFLQMEYSTTIVNAHQLQLMAMNLGASYTLGADIDMAELANPSGMWGTQSATILTGITMGFAPIGNSTTPFTGQFDGLNHTITNLTINRPSQDYIGLFGYTGSGSTINNVGLVGGSVTGHDYVGELVGENYYGTVSNAYATGNVIGSTCVGGLIGYNFNGTVSNAYAIGSVSGSTQVGGLAGNNAVGSISNSYAAGNVSGSDYVGGLVGYNYGNISNAYATGSVSGSSEVGGLLGRTFSGTVSNSYAIGKVTGSGSVGGLIGRFFSGAINSSYWDTITSGTSTGVGSGSISGVTGLTTAQMMTMSSFSGWDIANTGGTSAIWRIYEGNTYPLLRSFLTPLTVTADNVSKTYDGLVYTGSATNVSYSDPNASASGHLFGTGGYVNAKNASTYLPNFWSDQQGYDISYVNSTLTVNTLALTGSITEGISTYGAVLVPGTASFSNAIAGDDLGTATVAVETTGLTSTSGNLKAGTHTGIEYISALGGADAGNYTFNDVTGDYTVNKLDLAVSGLTASDKVYDGTPTATVNGTAAVTPLASDDVTIGGTAIGAFADKNVGTDKNVTVTGNTISGTDADNYNMIQQTGLTADITKAPLTIQAVRNVKWYDGTTAAAAIPIIVNGALYGSDTANFIETYDNLYRGWFKVLTPSGTVNDGNGGNNYEYTFINNGWGKIIPRSWLWWLYWWLW